MISKADLDPVAIMVLNAVYDAGGDMDYEALREAIPASGSSIWKALRSEYHLGNVKRRHDDEPITLTASARSAIAAGRAIRADILADRAVAERKAA